MNPLSIAHYRITAKLGEGGMGAVYRAIDTKLDREVAIKILPEAFAQDPDRLARFTRKAKVLAVLNHPNIAQIYGIEEGALVMELVPGSPLKGPLPLATLLPDPGAYFTPRFSPDGRRLAVGVESGKGLDIFTYDL